MSDYPDWYTEHVRRKALAELRIANEISKQSNQSQSDEDDLDVEPTENEIHQRFQKAQDISKPSFGMMFFSGMLTLTSVVLVSLCFITTINSYDMALNDTEKQVPDVVTIVQSAGPLNAMAARGFGGGPFSPFGNRMRMQPRFAGAFHFNRPPRFMGGR